MSRYMAPPCTSKSRAFVLAVPPRSLRLPKSDRLLARRREQGTCEENAMYAIQSTLPFPATLVRLPVPYRRRRSWNMNPQGRSRHTRSPSASGPDRRSSMASVAPIRDGCCRCRAYTSLTGDDHPDSASRNPYRALLERRPPGAELAVRVCVKHPRGGEHHPSQGCGDCLWSSPAGARCGAAHRGHCRFDSPPGPRR